MSHKALIKRLTAGFESAQKGDKMVVNYRLDLDYIGEVYQNLLVIEQLLDSPTVIGSADMKALNGGRILIQDIVRKIDRIKDLI